MTCPRRSSSCRSPHYRTKSPYDNDVAKPCSGPTSHCCLDRAHQGVEVDRIRVPEDMSGTVGQVPLQQLSLDRRGLLDGGRPALGEEEAELTVDLEQRPPLLLQGREHVGGDRGPRHRLDRDVVPVVAG